MTGRARAYRVALLGACGVAVACAAGVRSASRRANPTVPTAVSFAGAQPARVSGGAYDGADRLLFDVIPADRAPLRIHASRHVADGWSTPSPAIAGFDDWHAGAQVSPDGARLYFESPRRTPAVAGREDTDLWIAERAGDGWGNARPVGAPFDTPFNEHNVTVGGRGTICINSNRSGITARHDVLCARRAGDGWEEPRPLGAAVNGPANEIAPFIDADERVLLFASNRAGGAGDFDLYVARRRGDDWEPAVSLGPTVNTAASESNPALSRDGTRLLFTRSAEGRNTLYEVRFDPRWLGATR